MDIKVIFILTIIVQLNKMNPYIIKEVNTMNFSIKFFSAMALFVILVIGCFAQNSIECVGEIPSFMIAQNDGDYEEYEEHVVPTKKVKKLTYSSSYNRGIRDAESRHSTTGYFLGGVGSGIMLGLIGTAIIGIAAGGTSPDYIPNNVNQEGYISGYRKKAKSKNTLSAVGGGLLGTAVIVIAVVAAGGG